MKTQQELLKELAAKWIDEDRFLCPQYAKKCAIEVLAILALSDDTVSVPTDAMVESGCVASYQHGCDSKWSKLSDEWKVKYRKAMRAALIAAHLESLK